MILEPKSDAGCGTLKALLLNAGNTAGMVKGLLMLSLGPVSKDIEPDGFLMWNIYIYIHTYIHIHNGILPSHKKNKILPFATTWMT